MKMLACCCAFAMLIAGTWFAPPSVHADTIEINTAETTMRDIDALYPGGGAPKTALVTPTGSVALSSTVDPAIWAKSTGWTVTVSPGRTVQGGDYGILFNEAKDGSGNDLKGTLVNAGSVSANGGAWIFGVETGAGSTITNQSGATISGTAATTYGLGIYADEGSTISNAGSISGSAASSNGIGIWAEKNSTITNQAGAAISGTAASNGRGIYGKSGITVDNRGTISGSSASGSGYGIYGTGGGWTIANHEGATISASGAASLFTPVHGITLFNNPANTITNNGTITVTCSGGPCGGITGSHNTINTGTITVTRTGGASRLAAYGLDVSGTITNSGRIEVKNESASGGATGISAKLPDSTLTNKSGGIISVTAATSSGATAVQIVKGTVTNEEGASITSSGTGVVLGDSILKNAVSLTNHGAISGARGVYAPGGNAIIDNYGTIISETGIVVTGGNTIIRNYSSGTITGTGGIAISLAGDNNTILIQRGSTVNGSIEAGGSGNTLEFNGPGSYGSNITGTWALMKSGSGTLTLSGTNTYTGPTTIDDGALAVNGSIASPVTVSGSVTGYGTLMGTGSINGNVTNSGHIAPGNSIGTLTINGDYTHQAGAVYEVEVNAAGVSDRINVTGKATINGGTVQVLAEDGSYKPSTDYTILHADGSRTGQFADVTSNLAFLDPTLSYTANDVILTLVRNSADFASTALTDNQRAVASILDASSGTATGDMRTVLDGLLTLSAPGARRAFDQMGGTTYTAFPIIDIDRTYQYLHTLFRRGSSLFFNPQSFSASNNPHLQRFAAAGTVMTDASVQPVTTTGPWGLWINGYGVSGGRSGDDIGSQYDYTIGGIIGGLDYAPSKSFRGGISFGYSHTKVDFDDLSDRGKADSIQVGLYGSYTTNRWYLDSALYYAHNKYDMTRSIAFGPIYRVSEGDYKGYEVAGYAEGGYCFLVNRFEIRPMLSFLAVRHYQDSFTETGAGSLSLHADSQRYWSIRSALGARFAYEFGKKDGAAFTPEVSARWVHEFGDDQYSLDARFAGYPAGAFEVRSDKVKRDSAVLGAGFTGTTGKNTSFFLFYDVSLREKHTDHALTGGIRYVW
ncbi:MAG: autotransporter domain-containing protein [Syntrophorhabdus aromaticivorans]|uniref:Autotransporter domain-containing protein n=1 Tax=Syntrophorhabdus aromaticivorans TaxID=328301 RepID=A0A971M469_9BACT|nr:autotransporter domain-containing protein [Syntrophorhabdus aromaticivorans]